MVSVCLPSDALSQHLPLYLGLSYLGRGVSLHSCSSKVQLLLLTLDEGHLLTSAPPDLEHGVAPLGTPRLRSHCSLDMGLIIFSATAPVFIEPFKFSFFGMSVWGIDSDSCDIEWLALETNRDHSVIFEIASKGAIPRPRSSGCVGAEGPRGAILRSRSEGAAVRRDPSSKVRSCFAGAATKRYPTSNVRETQVRQ